MSSLDVITDAISAKEPTIQELNRDLWHHPEGAFQEFDSQKILIRALKREGFSITEHVCRLSTAFIAKYGTGHPIVAVTTDLDALPGLSQEAGQSEYSPLNRQEYGHGCGHSAIGAGSFAAALGAKAYLEKSGHSGTILFVGCPGEENGGGKTFLVRGGVFDGVDCAFTWHPGDHNGVSASAMNANVIVVFRYRGISAHAALVPHLGRSALSAAELTNIGVNYLREYMIPEARVHYAYLDAGGPAANIVQDHAALQYSIRAPLLSQAVELLESVVNIAKGAALMAGTELEYQVTSSIADYSPNDVLSLVLSESFAEVGPPEFDESDYKIARSFFETLPETVRRRTVETIGKRFGEDHVTEVLDRPLDTTIERFDPGQRTLIHASSDIGDVSYIVPVAQASAAAVALGTPMHSWSFTGQVGTTISDKAVLAVGRAIALACAKIYEKNEILSQAQAEFQTKRAGRYLCLLQDGAVPMPQK